MILGIGMDVVSLARISEVYQRWRENFLKKCFSPHEQSILGSIKRKDQFLAKRFAAKEAVAKACGVGIGPKGTSWRDIQIDNHNSGAPFVTLRGDTKKVFDSLVPKGYKWNLHLTMADDESNAYAWAILACEPQKHNTTI